MYSKPQIALKWLRYRLRASSGKGHGIHSPFVFEFIRAVLRDKKIYPTYAPIESRRAQLLRDMRILRVNDLGAGSNSGGERNLRVRDIARTALSDVRFGRLLYRLANFYRAENIIELGSSLGISGAYLASANPAARVTTLEGSPAIAEMAKETFVHLGLRVNQITGNFDDGLPELIRQLPPADLVFIDGNHRKEAVLDYVYQFMDKLSGHALIVIHDIYWSREMEDAWNILQDDPRVKMSIDIFTAGLIFFRSEFIIKQKFTIRF